MTGVMEAFAENRARDEAAYTLTPLRSWNGTPADIYAMVCGRAEPPAPGVGNNDFALHLAVFLLEHGLPLPPHDLVYLGIYDDSTVMDFCGGSSDERGGGPHFTWGCLTDTHLGSRRWTGFGLDEPEVFLVPRNGIIEHIMYSGGRLSSADMERTVDTLRRALSRAFPIFESVQAYARARPGELDVEKLAIAVREYAQRLTGLQRELS